MKNMTKFYREDFENVHYYLSPEMDFTKANGVKTLYVTGFRSTEQLITVVEEHNCKNVHFGALGTFQKNKKQCEIIEHLLSIGIQVTVEYPLSSHDWVQENFTDYLKDRNFIPIINITIDNIENLNQNTVIKFDDTSWNETNRGVWSITTNELLNSNRFVSWDEFVNEEVLWTSEDQSKMMNEKRNYVYGKKKNNK